MSAAQLEVSGWKDRSGRVWRLLEDVPQSEVPTATPLYSQATVDTLRAQLEAAERAAQALADTLTLAVARAEAAEAEVARLRHAGAMLANCAFNLAQRKHLTDEERRSLDLSRIAWDAARTETKA